MARIGLCLSGGGVRALAHVGIVTNLNWSGIPVAMVSGTSVGAVIAAAVAAGISTDRMKSVLSRIGYGSIFSPILPYLGFSSFNKLRRIFTRLGIPRTFDELKMPLYVATTDLVRRETVYFDSGNLWDALCASMALPGVFSPLRMGGMLLVDGGMTNNLPVSVLKDHGADFVIASDVNKAGRSFSELSSSFRILYESATLLVETATIPERGRADFIIDTPLEGVPFISVGKASHVLEQGYRQSTERIKDLRKLLEERQYVPHRNMGPLFVGPLS